MHVHHVGFRIKGFYRLAQFGPLGEHPAMLNTDSPFCSSLPVRPSSDL